MSAGTEPRKLAARTARLLDGPGRGIKLFEFSKLEG